MERPAIRIVPGGPMLVDGLPLGRLEHDGGDWRLDPVTEAGSSYLGLVPDRGSPRGAG